MAEFKRSFYGLFQLAAPTAFVIYGWRWMHVPGIESTKPDFTCPELIESTAHAKQTLPYFIGQVKGNVHNALVKFPLRTPSGMTEHIWGYVHSYQDGKFNVSLANEPVSSTTQADGRRDVDESEVEDWQIMLPDGKIKGGHSLIALFRHRENQGKKLTSKMRRQKAQLVDAI